MPELLKIVAIVGMVFFLSACGIKGGSQSPLRFKHITPAMAMEMEMLIQAGCDQEYEYFDRDIAMLYSLIPGGGQWYTGMDLFSFFPSDSSLYCFLPGCAEFGRLL